MCTNDVICTVWQEVLGLVMICFALSSLLWAGHLFIFCYHYCIVAVLVAMCKMMVNQFSFLPSL